MATRFVRIDLSDNARDFRPVAIEPGVPLLDRANGNGKILLRWFGGLVAEPEWEGESVYFFVCDDYGGRLEEVACYPASEDDLGGCLRKDLELLKERLEAAKAESSTQRAVLRAVHQSLTPLLDDTTRLDRDNYFFCYQDVDRRWRLVWCPGYQRTDQTPGRSVICSNRACRLLYVRRQGASGKCPGCQAPPVERPKPQVPPVRIPKSLVALLLLLLAIGMGYWLWKNRPVVVADNVKPADPVVTEQPTPEVDPSKPTEVKISSKQGDSVTFPVGAEFTDFRIEAFYSSGYKRFVTKKATLRVPDGENAPLEISDGTLIGLKPGKVDIHAEFEGVSTKTPLHAEVTATLQADQLQVRPASEVKVTPGESIPVEAEAFWKGNSRGVINALSGLSWKSSDEKVARASGGTVTGVNLGEATLKAQYADLASDPTKVEVVASDGDPLVVAPKAMRLRVGQSARLGVDLTLVRGEGATAIDVSNECKISSASQDKVRYLPEAQAILGVAPGVSVVAFSHGEQMASTSVEVVEAAVAADGEVLIEPATGILSPGQGESLRVFVLTKEGTRIDQTATATWNSSAPTVATVEKGQLRAIAPGTARLTAAVPGVQATGHATMIVQDQPVQSLVVEPSALRLQVGDRAELSFHLRSASGLHDVSNPADVKITVGGPNPGAVRIDQQRVVGVAAGDAVLSLELAGKQAGQVPVRVDSDPWTDLALDPQSASIPQGEAVLYILSGVRGGQRRALWPQDGVRLSVSDTAVGEVMADGMTVRGRALGQTTVTAEFAGKKVEAPFRVVAVGQAPTVVGNRPTDVVVIDPATGRFVGGTTVFDPYRERIIGRGGSHTSHDGFIEGVTDGVWAGNGPAPTAASGERFGNISTETENERDKDFGVRATIDAPLGQAPLEYRVYPPGTRPPETWVLAQSQGERQRAVLHYGRLTRGDADASYRLIFEARPQSGGSSQQYPYTFQLKSTIVPNTTSEP